MKQENMPLVPNGINLPIVFGDNNFWEVWRYLTRITLQADARQVFCQEQVPFLQRFSKGY
jgi:hypothetical protein